MPQIQWNSRWISRPISRASGRHVRSPSTMTVLDAHRSQCLPTMPGLWTMDLRFFATVSWQSHEEPRVKRRKAIPLLQMLGTVHDQSYPNHSHHQQKICWKRFGFVYHYFRRHLLFNLWGLYTPYDAAPAIVQRWPSPRAAMTP